MTTYKIISLRIVTAPATGIVLDAPPVLVASDHSVDYACGRCSTILLHAEEDQVRGFLIRCTKCGSYNSMDF
jgi:DNA-directed RNA polymerase subunit RPC12/RpoP